MADNIIIPGSICARLIDAGIITKEQLEEALEIQKTSKFDRSGCVSCHTETKHKKTPLL